MAFTLLDHTEEKTTIDEILTGTFREKDRQINFAIEELEKIKADIKEASYDRLDGFNGGQMVVDWEDIEDMFYYHISELKGENNNG